MAIHDPDKLWPKHHRLVHEDGYDVRKDVRDRWYFRRPDGRAIPDSGYLPDDMIDDDISGHSLEPYPNPSAEGSTDQSGHSARDGVCESPAMYQLTETSPRQRWPYSVTARLTTCY